MKAGVDCSLKIVVCSLKIGSGNVITVDTYLNEYMLHIICRISRMFRTNFNQVSQLLRLRAHIQRLTEMMVFSSKVKIEEK